MQWPAGASSLFLLPHISVGSAACGSAWLFFNVFTASDCAMLIPKQ
jgi:hypothetical protein